MRVFLTGGTGLLGGHVAARLIERGHEVVALVRSGSDAARLRRLGARLVTGDITADAEGSLSRAAAGCQGTVHAAALLYRKGARAGDYEAVNVTGTERVLRAAAAAGASRAILVSSIAVYGPGRRGERYTEESWRDRAPAPRNSYARSKRLAEAAAWRLHDAGLVRLSTVRPGVLYGEGDRWFTVALARIVAWPVIPLPAGGKHTVPVVYAGNAADGVVAALEGEQTVGEAYNLSQDEPLTIRALVKEFARALGRRPRLLSVPGLLVEGIATGTDVALRAFPAEGGADVRRAAMRILQDNAYPAEKARRELDWTARVPSAEALARTARWWQSAHMRAEGVER